MTTWIFQGNPDRFNINNYLTTINPVYWTVSLPAHQKRVAVGDTIFIWRARGSTDFMPGVIAVGTVIEPCRPKGEVDCSEYLSDDLWVDAELEPDEVKSGIYVHEVRLTEEAGMLSLYDLRLDPILAKMKVITVQTGSNFPLNEKEALRLRHLWQNANDVSEEEAFGDYKATEGRVKIALHKMRERDPNLVRHAKQLFIQRHGSLYCEICGFSFESTYDSLGQGFIEAHHIKPLSELNSGETTLTSDLIMVCSNCHRMIHRGNAEKNLDALTLMFKSKRLSSA